MLLQHIAVAFSQNLSIYEHWRYNLRVTTAYCCSFFTEVDY